MTLYRITIEQTYSEKRGGLFSLGTLRTILVLHKFEVIRETPCGYWFIDLNHKERWVSKDSRIAYAYAKIQDARRNFIKRSQKREQLLTEQLNRTKEGPELVKTFYKPKEKF